MSMLLRPMIFTSWRDTSGGFRDSAWTSALAYAVWPNPLQGVSDAAAALSNAGRIGMAYQAPLLVGSSPVTGPFGCGDAATFYMKSSAGLVGVLSIPDPKPAIFLGDGVTVDQSNSLVATFLGEAMAFLGDTAGNPWNSVRQANRTRFPG